MAEESFVALAQGIAEPPPLGAAFGQVLALPAYIPPDNPDGSRGGDIQVPPPTGAVPNTVVLKIVWAGYPSTGRGGQAWED